ncbi:cupredoxin domain-containing protein [Candidatus Nitrosotalea okcheonensis]|nr:plastocyanin/azurin family copper-binding protein [Candidatus Nitrosotalea okcheonensis]MDE1840828.1 cupredoxin domain-containing protein [Nitrososphaerota archaeon]MDE1878598.1 cupredoxin domain-containing protein [Nitrososphaerota archaeon]
MSDWDLMMPGMGLSAIGLAGVILSYLGIANTFLTGMQALSGLTLFIGLVFLSAGILSGGVSTSPRAKATTLVIFGIAGSVATYALSLNKVITSLTVFVGLLLIIVIPTIVLAFFSMKMPKHFKPVATIFIAAMVVAIGSYTVFGFIGPGAQFHLNSISENATNATAPTSNVPVISIDIPANASIKGNPSFIPNSVSVPKGDIIEWKNDDKVGHTVTSADGTTWDSGIISAGKTFRLDTSKLNATTYQYLCTVHPIMSGSITITAPMFANVTISSGASKQAAGQKYFDPQESKVKAGTTVVWTNADSVAHTVTSGNPSDSSPGGLFDSGLIKPGKTFQQVFNTAGTTSYFCTVHPWMTGKVTVG